MPLSPHAVDAYLARPFQDWSVYKQLSDKRLDAMARKHGIPETLWLKLRWHQKIMMLILIRAKKFALWSDTGCVSAETLLETSEGPIRIDKLHQHGQPIRVWSQTSDGVRLVNATCPFKRGPTALYEVRFASGRSITVSERHRFLSERGWLPCADVSRGVCLPIFDVSRQQSISAPLVDASHISPTTLAAASLSKRDRRGVALDDACVDIPLSASFDSIVSVQYKCTDFYYDLHVPVHENYIAHGLCHHNTGKTLTILSTALYLHQQRQLRHLLVLVPRKANKEEWLMQAEEHMNGQLTISALPSNTEEKHQALADNDTLITVETYSGLYYLACEKKTVKGVNRLKPSPRLVRRITNHFDGIVLDESHTVKTKNKLPYRLCRKIAKNANVVVAMSGTPHGRDPSDLWGQMMLVDGGKTLGETLGLFREVFFSKKKGFFADGYVFRQSKSGLLNRILNNRSIRFEVNAADLPEVNEIVKRVSLPEDAESYYKRAFETLRQQGDVSEIRNAWLRMRQISSGFIGFHDDETGKKAQFEFDENPKLEMLLSLLESLHHKAIVFYEYTWSGLRIVRELKKLGIGVLHMYGGCKDQEGTRRRFTDDPKINVLVLQNSFGEGLNLQAARYGFFFESPVSPITRKQCRRRFERQYSEHGSIFLYDLVCRKTVDDSILKMLKEGQDLFDLVINGKIKIDLLAG